MIALFRWLLFLPAGFIAAVVAGAVGSFGAGRYSEFVGFTTSGGFSAAGFIYIGMLVAPKRNEIVKWILIVPSFLCGVLSSLADFIAEDDKLRVSMGISMAVLSLLFAAIPAKEMFRNESTHKNQK